MRNRTAICLALLSSALPARAQPVTDAGPEANPARPTISTPATRTLTGYLQFETGSLGETSSPEFGTRIGIDEVAKLTVLPRLEVFVQTEPFVHSSDRKGQNQQIHPGEVFLGAQTLVVSANAPCPQSQ